VFYSRQGWFLFLENLLDLSYTLQDFNGATVASVSPTVWPPVAVRKNCPNGSNVEVEGRRLSHRQSHGFVSPDVFPSKVGK
jgi:hypothetical protein